LRPLQYSQTYHVQCGSPVVSRACGEDMGT
jgi:hypothetical protein